ncbi:hypothetical protein N665_0211s0021 [Sinapis alba]|nr:hypothetical protein N665_0211s0021 [Sinapis alba]
MVSKGKKPIRGTPTRRIKRIKDSSSPCSINSDITSTSSSTSVSSTATLVSPSGCCTPISKKSRIPEMLTCPSAPKKQRVARNFFSTRRKISFFASPDVELFFVIALGHNHGQAIDK